MSQVKKKASVDSSSWQININTVYLLPNNTDLWFIPPLEGPVTQQAI